MDATISSRREAINTAVLVFIILATVNVAVRVPGFESNLIFQLIALLTAKGAYELIIRFLHWLVNQSDTILKLYWGKLYLKGLWSYEYFLDGQRYFGIWDIRQNVNGTTLVGNGLSDQYLLRTIVRSVSPLFEETNGYYFINSRNEMENQNAEVFSKTTLLLDRPKGFLRGVQSMRGITVVYGGPSDKQVHPNVTFRKHTHVSSVDELVSHLRTQAQLPTVS